MKKILYLMVCVLSVLSFSSCGDDSSEGLTRITYFPSLVLQGGSTVYVDKGSTWKEPGFTSTMNGEDVSSQVTISGTVDTSKSGIYYLTYTSMTNEDGFNSTATREVIVTDPNDPIEGIWTTNSSTSYRSYNGSSRAFAGDFQILILNNGDGSYYVSDLFAGWYDQGSGYGPNYACVGTITIAPNGTISLVSSSVAGWGDSLVGFTDGSYDAANNTIHYDAEYASGMHFIVDLSK